MHYRQKPCLLLTALLVSALLVGPFRHTHAAPPRPDPVMARARQAVDKGLNYLRRVQETDGSWSEYPATTALALTAFLRNGHNELNEPAVARGVKFLLRSVKPSGAIYNDANPATALPNYNTCLSVMALTLTRNAAYKSILQKAQKYLENSQFDEGEGITPGNPIYGGIGYGSDPDDHPDLSNLQTALEALKESGTPAASPVWKKAIIFLQRVQNRRESNDQAWVKEGPDDGGFVYDSTGESKVKDGKHTSMGAMSYAGLKSYLYAGVSKSDPRAQAAWNWIRGHYTVTEHPGMGDTSLYYYYHTMAKTLDVYGQKIVTDTRGKTHDWSHDLAAQMVAVQHPDGSWFNTNARYWENQPSLVTSYTLIALSYCVKR
jgi:squalene-hopene/tetraprenyl-beta-curcumene cyclase